MPKKRGKCHLPDCDEPHFGRGLCYKHWRRLTRHGTTERLIEDHGLTHTPEYRVWVRMWERCTDPNQLGYENYGGRGITVCPEWKGFSAFFESMGARPTSEHSLDRIDTNGPYSPANCRWASRVQQDRNKRNNVFLTLGERTQIMSDWANELDIPLTTILYRKRRGLSDEECLNPIYARRLSRK